MVLRLPNNIIVVLKTKLNFLSVKEGIFLPLRLSCKDSSTFLTKPLFNGLYTPFSSPVCGGQKPQREGPYPIPKP